MGRWREAPEGPLRVSRFVGQTYTRFSMSSSHRVHALQGGARLVTATLPERHSTSLVFMFGGGSRLEDERQAGVSHFIEHLNFKGTQRRPTSKEIADAIEGVGGFINASTDKELTAYWTRVPAE